MSLFERPRVAVEDLVLTLQAHRYIFSSEARLQEGVRLALRAASLPFEEQVVLSPKDRIDFLVGGDIGLELKIDGSRNDIWRQMERYVASPRVRELVLASTRRRHTLTLPSVLGGKPITLVHLRAWL